MGDRVRCSECDVIHGPRAVYKQLDLRAVGRIWTTCAGGSGAPWMSLGAEGSDFSQKLNDWQQPQPYTIVGLCKKSRELDDAPIGSPWADDTSLGFAKSVWSRSPYTAPNHNAGQQPVFPCNRHFKQRLFTHNRASLQQAVSGRCVLGVLDVAGLRGRQDNIRQT
jgi:hypothetical protein